MKWLGVGGVIHDHPTVVIIVLKTGYNWLQLFEGLRGEIMWHHFIWSNPRFLYRDRSNIDPELHNLCHVQIEASRHREILAGFQFLSRRWVDIAVFSLSPEGDIIAMENDDYVPDILVQVMIQIMVFNIRHSDAPVCDKLRTGLKALLKMTDLQMRNQSLEKFYVEVFLPQFPVEELKYPLPGKGLVPIVEGQDFFATALTFLAPVPRATLADETYYGDPSSPYRLWRELEFKRFLSRYKITDPEEIAKLRAKALGTEEEEDYGRPLL